MGNCQERWGVKKCSFGQICLVSKFIKCNDISIKIRPHMSWLISYSTDSQKMLKWKKKKRKPLYHVFKMNWSFFWVLKEITIITSEAFSSKVSLMEIQRVSRQQ